MRFLPVRDDALLVELDDLAQTITLASSLAEHPISGVGEPVSGARTLLLPFRPSAVTPAAIVAEVRSRDLSRPAVETGDLVEIPVRYDGEDLDEVATLVGITAGAVVALHTGSEYSVGFTGFAPGFAYLSGGHPALMVPRRSSPRTRVPAGAVALAGSFSGVYPRESPGGWQLIGTTDLGMWNLAREKPALITPGDRVRFVEVTDARRPPPRAAFVHPLETSPPTSALEVLSPGPLALLQDAGRPGHTSMGVSTSGALDLPTLRAANRLVGNAVHTACLELTFGGARLRAIGELVVAVTGAGVPLSIEGEHGTRPAPFGRAFALGAGEELVLGTPAAGIRSYLAVRGGFDIPPVLGSLSTDVLAGLGPLAVAPGTVLPVHAIVVGLPAVSVDEVAPVEVDDPAVLDVVLGPRTDWFTLAAVRSLGEQVFTVSARSNRVGLRLDGDPLERAVHAELPSEGTVAGALQVPPDGHPVLFLADHPVTGGYPVIGAVTSRHLPLAGRLAPGSHVRFRPLAPFEEYR